MGKRAEGGERKFPFGVEVGARGQTPSFLREAWGRQEAGCEGERAAGSWFPRSPRAPHSVSLQVSTQFCQHRGAVLHPAQPARDTGGSGERLRARGVWGGKNGPSEFTRTLLFQPTVRLTRQPLRAGPPLLGQPLVSSPQGPCGSPSTRSRETTPSSLRAAGYGPRSLDRGQQMSSGN